MTDEAEEFLLLETPSASSILRQDLARLQEEDLGRYHETIKRRRPASELYHRPPTPTGPSWYTLWQPPMPFPPPKPQPSEPAPELPNVNRRPMNMRLNLTLSEDQPPHKISRQNSQIAQNHEQMTFEAMQDTQNHASISGLQIRQPIPAQDTTLTLHQTTQNQQVEPMEQNPKLNEDENIPQLFKAIANKQV